MIGNIVMMAIGMVMMGVGAGMIPTMIVGFETARVTTNASSYTGLTNVIAVGPTIIVLGFIIAGGVTGFLGIKGIINR